MRPPKGPRALIFPNVKRHDPDPEKMAALVVAAELSITQAAARIGVPARTLQRYCSPEAIGAGHLAPYPVQFALERLAASRVSIIRRRGKRQVPHA